MLSLVRTEPFEELQRMRREVHRLLEDVFPKGTVRPQGIPEFEWVLPVRDV